jgi:putative transposase
MIADRADRRSRRLRWGKVMSTAGIKRHSKAEIVAKVAQADDLAAQGMVQREIVHALGVSVMTLHRWRKATSRETPQVVEVNEMARPREPVADRAVTEIEIENARLRRLVVDLLLEKIKLEEGARRRQGISRPRPSLTARLG